MKTYYVVPQDDAMGNERFVLYLIDEALKRGLFYYGLTKDEIDAFESELTRQRQVACGLPGRRTDRDSEANGYKGYRKWKLASALEGRLSNDLDHLGGVAE